MLHFLHTLVKHFFFLPTQHESYCTLTASLSGDLFFRGLLGSLPASQLNECLAE